MSNPVLAEKAVVVDGVDKIFNVGSDSEVAALSDLLAPTTGALTVFGKSAHEARLDQDYGMVFQHSGLFDWRRVLANIELPLELRGWSKADRSARSAEMLGLVRLEDFGGHYPRQLSGGMQQRVSIARALSFQPKLLLMDEPFGALDEMTREHMQLELLRIWRETHTTVVFVTHSIPESAFLSNRVVVLSPRPGRIHSVVDVDLGERSDDTRQDPAFFAKATEIREALRAVEGGG